MIRKVVGAIIAFLVLAGPANSQTPCMPNWQGVVVCGYKAANGIYRQYRPYDIGSPQFFRNNFPPPTRPSYMPAPRPIYLPPPRQYNPPPPRQFNVPGPRPLYMPMVRR